MFFSLDFGKLKLVLSISSYGISTVNSFIFFTRPFKADIFFISTEIFLQDLICPWITTI